MVLTMVQIFEPFLHGSISEADWPVRTMTSGGPAILSMSEWLNKYNLNIFRRLVLEKQEKFDGHQQFFAIVQLIGTRKQAENFAYR